jgi:hypothetical protein
MDKRKLRHGIDVALLNFDTSLIGGERGRCLVDRQVGPESVGTFPSAERTQRLQHIVWHRHGGQQALSGDDACALDAIRLSPTRAEALWIAFEGQPAPDNLGALNRICHWLDFHGKTEAVEQLRPQVALLGVHRADQHESRGVPKREPLTLHVIHTHGRRIEQQVNKMVAQQVHFIDVEKPPMRGGEQSRLEASLTGQEGPFEVQAAHHAIVGCTHGQVHEGDRPPHDLRWLRERPLRHSFSRRAMERVFLVHINRRQ